MSKIGTYLTKKHFDTFKKEARRWIDRLGLLDWRIDYQFEECHQSLAECRRDYEGRCATLVLNPFQERVKRKDVDVKARARHEVMHLLMAEVAWLNGKRCVTDDIWSAAEHCVIRRLEDAFK